MPIHDWSRVDAGVFHDFHLAWIDVMRSELNAGLLPEPFYAIAEQIAGGVVPDVLTLHEQDEDGAQAYAKLTRRVVIRSSLPGDKIIAVIELVALGSKDGRSHTEQSVTKTLSLLDEGVHVLVIDVQAATRAVPHGFHALICDALGPESPELPAERNRQAVSYQVLEGGYPRAHVVPLKVGDALPEMPIFLSPHLFVRLPLEATYVDAFGRIARKFRKTLEG